MKRLVYLAAAYTQADRMRYYRELLRELDWQVVSQWIDNKPDDIPIGIDQLTEPGPDAGDDAILGYRPHYAAAVMAASQNVNDLWSASVLLIFTDIPSTSGGYHVEFGMALADRKRIIIILTQHSG